jgi:hypothetical protein
MKSIRSIIVCTLVLFSGQLHAAPRTAGGWHHQGLRYLHGAIKMMPDTHAGTEQQEKALVAVEHFDAQLPKKASGPLSRAIKLFANKTKAVLSSYGSAPHKRMALRKVLTRSYQQLTHAAKDTPAAASVDQLMKHMKTVLPHTVREKKRRWGTWLMKGLGVAGVIALVIALMNKKGLKSIAGTSEKGAAPKDVADAVQQRIAREVIKAALPGKPSDKKSTPTTPNPETQQLQADAITAVAARAGVPIENNATNAQQALHQVGDAALKRVAGTKLHATTQGSRLQEACWRAVQSQAAHALKEQRNPTPQAPPTPEDAAITTAREDALRTGVQLAAHTIAGEEVNTNSSTGHTDTVVRALAQRLRRPAPVNPANALPTIPEVAEETAPSSPLLSPETQHMAAEALRHQVREHTGINAAAANTLQEQVSAISTAATQQAVNAAAGTKVDQSDAPDVVNTMARIAAERVVQAAEAPPQPAKPWLNEKTNQHLANAFRRAVTARTGIKGIKERRTLGAQIGSTIQPVARHYLGDTTVDTYNGAMGAPLEQQQSAREAALQAKREREETERRGREMAQMGAEDAAQHALIEQERLAQEHAAQEARREAQRMREEAATQAAHEAELAAEKARIAAQHAADKAARQEALHAAEAAALQKQREREAAEEAAAAAERREKKQRLAAAQREAAQAADDARIAREAEATQAARQAAAREEAALIEERKKRGALGNLVGMSNAALHDTDLEKAQQVLVEAGPRIQAKRKELAAAATAEEAAAIQDDLSKLEAESAAADAIMRKEKVRNPDIFTRGMLGALDGVSRAVNWARGTSKAKEEVREAAVARDAARREIKDRDRAMAYAALMREQRELEDAQKADAAVVASSQGWSPWGASKEAGVQAQARIKERMARIDKLEAAQEEYQQTLGNADIERAQRIAFSPRPVRSASEEE